MRTKMAFGQQTGLTRFTMLTPCCEMLEFIISSCCVRNNYFTMLCCIIAFGQQTGLTRLTKLTSCCVILETSLKAYSRDAFTRDY